MRSAIIAAFLLAHANAAFAAPQALASNVQTYDDLLHAIRKARAASGQRIVVAIEEEKVREAWETGKLIDEHILQHKERAAYGEQVIVRLAKDLGASETELKYMLQFARTYPIRRPADELSWSHYQALLSLNDPKEREEVTKEAVKQGWSRDRLREEVRRRQARAEPKPKLLEAKPGTLHTYRVVRDFVGENKNELVIDLGFANYLKLEKKLKFKDGDIVQLVKGKLKKSESLKEQDLYTFEAEVIRVLDGDTFAASVDLGFGFTTVQTLRLRGLDAPEIYTSEGSPGRDVKISPGSPRATGLEGQEAKAFVEAQFAKARGKVLIKTVKSDKYDRYLADVWVGEKYLNQELINSGLAVRVTE